MTCGSPCRLAGCRTARAQSSAWRCVGAGRQASRSSGGYSVCGQCATALNEGAPACSWAAVRQACHQATRGAVHHSRGTGQHRSTQAALRPLLPSASAALRTAATTLSSALRASGRTPQEWCKVTWVTWAMEHNARRAGSTRTDACHQLDALRCAAEAHLGRCGERLRHHVRQLHVRGLLLGTEPDDQVRAQSTQVGAQRVQRLQEQPGQRPPPSPSQSECSAHTLVQRPMFPLWRTYLSLWGPTRGRGCSALSLRATRSSCDSAKTGTRKLSLLLCARSPVMLCRAGWSPSRTSSRSHQICSVDDDILEAAAAAARWRLQLRVGGAPGDARALRGCGLHQWRWWGPGRRRHSIKPAA